MHSCCDHNAFDYKCMLCLTLSAIDPVDNIDKDEIRKFSLRQHSSALTSNLSLVLCNMFIPTCKYNIKMQVGDKDRTIILKNAHDLTKVHSILLVDGLWVDPHLMISGSNLDDYISKLTYLIKPYTDKPQLKHILWISTGLDECIGYNIKV